MIARTLAAVILATVLTGCSIHTNKSADSEKTDKVDIRTPMGSLKVRSSDVDVKDTGLPVFPGAERIPETDDKNSNSANVDIDTPVFQLKVVAVKFKTTAPAAKVLEFYRKEMKTFPGKFLECPGVGNMSDINPDGDSKTKDLSCDEKNRGEGTDLKVGSPNKQRVVHVEPKGTGSEFSLVYVRAHGEKD